MRPVAAPNQALRRRLDEGLRSLRGLRIRRWPDLAVRIGARELDPGAALVDQLAHDLVRGMLDPRRQRRMRQMIEHYRGWQPPPHTCHLGDQLSVYVELRVTAEIRHARRQR